MSQAIWDYFKNKGLTSAGTAGLMGNLYAESGLNPTNLQNSYNTSLGMTDDEYTAAVDNGSYTNFVKDSAGYGLAQWTYWSRKQNLLSYCQAQNCSIGDLQAQLDFLYQELTTSYSQLLNSLKTTSSVADASYAVLTQFEKPADQSTSVQSKRASYAQGYYDTYEGSDYVGINITKKTSTNNTTAASGRNLLYIVIHYTAGVTSKAGSAANTASYFSTTTVQASADFIVDDETIVQYNPDLKNRYTWHCGGSKTNNSGGSLYGVAKNSNSIGIEICSTNSTGSVTSANDAYWSFTDAAVEKATELTKYLMETYNIDADHVIRHYDVTGKLCPGIIGWNADSGSDAKWMAFKAGLTEEDDTVTQDVFNEMMETYLDQLAEKSATWEKDVCDWAVAEGLIQGDDQGRIMAKKFMTRGEFMTVLKRFKDKYAAE